MAGDSKKNIPPRREEEIHADRLVRVIKTEKQAAEGDRLKDIEATPQNYKKFTGENRSGLPRGIMWGVIGLVALFIVGSVISFYVVKTKVKQSISSQIDTLQAGVSDLQNLDAASAQEKFAQLMQGSSTSLGSLMGAFSFLFQGGQAAINSFGDLAKQLATLSEEITGLQGSILDFAATGHGGDMLSGLKTVRDTLQAIDNDTNQLSGAAASVGASPAIGGTDFYLPLKARIEGAITFLNAFIPWFESSDTHHLLVLLQNPSEMRPGGGFLGSYADVVVAGGNVLGVSVHDIAEVDAGFTKKIIPPKPLQLEIKSWRPADGNWFFDFPTSASKTIEMFEQSKMYAASGTKFDGVIAITPEVMTHLLKITGPVTISSTSTKPRIEPTTFSADDLVVKIQNIVQQGQATAATYPKAILGLLAHELFTKFASSTDEQKQKLIAAAIDSVDKRDIMLYFKHPDFQNFVASNGAAGDMYELPQSFNGDYLAIVDANIRGDKTDLYIEQKVFFNAQIAADGLITDNLIIKRKHNGNKSPYWWYQTTSQDYLQIFAPDSSALTNSSGGVKKTIVPLVNYAQGGYSTDPLITTIESSTKTLFLYPAVTTHQEFGKEVFATWSRVAKGESTDLVFDYTHRAYLKPADGTRYQFIFEKQSGSNRSYDITIDAPLGYIFAENKLASFEYKSDDIPGRLILDLTLRRL